jgi:hypothetical protein
LPCRRRNKGLRAPARNKLGEFNKNKMKQFENWSKKAQNIFYIIFLVIIPVIVGIVAGTLGFLEKGIFGALANLIRCIFMNYMAYIPLGGIFFFFFDKEFRWAVIEAIAPWLFLALGIGGIIFLIWLLSNY